MDVTYQIIIADDHPLFRTALYQAIHMGVASSRVYEADSHQALHELIPSLDEVDLLLLDLKMPDADGLSGLETLRHDYPDLPIVVISANEDLNIVSQVKACGAFGFIPKSSQMQTLVQAINQVLGGEPYFPEGLAQIEAEHQEIREKLASLTPQQTKVLHMLNDGLLNKQIAYELDISEATIKAHMTAIFRKLGVNNRTQAVILLQQLQTNF